MTVSFVWWRCRCGKQCDRVVYAAGEMGSEAVAVRAILDLAPDVGGWAAICEDHGVIAWGLDGGSIDLGIVREHAATLRQNDFSMFFEEFESVVQMGSDAFEPDWIVLEGGTIDGGVLYGDGSQVQFHIEPGAEDDPE